MDQRKERFFEHVGVGLAELAPDGEIRLVNPALAAMMQCPAEDLVGRNFGALVHLPDAEAVRAALDQSLSYAGGRFASRLLTAGGALPVLLSVQALRDGPGSPGALLVEVHDTSEWVRAEERLALALEASGAAYFELAADLSWRQLDTSAARVLGHPLESIPAAGDALRSWFLEHVHSSDQEAVLSGFLALARGHDDIRMQCRFQNASDQERWLRIVARVGERDSEGRPCRITGIVHDVTRAQLEAQRIEHLAQHDPLTDLPNRILLMDRIRAARERLTRDGTQFGLLVMDLDRFKDVNDTLGHPVGDELLEAVARRLDATVRGTDTVARLGGDEFAIVQADVHSAANCAQLARKILKELRRPFHIRGHEVRTGTSIGAVVANNPGHDEDALFAMADVALYEAKENRGTFRLHSQDMAAESERLAQLSTDLHLALEAEAIDLAFLPQVDVSTGRPVAVEVLARWTHPELGPIPPSEFIPRAEDAGLIVSLGIQILDRALAAAHTWPKELSVCINLSALQLKDRRFEHHVTEALARHRVSPRRLILELGDDTLAGREVVGLETLMSLAGQGVRLVADDVGIGAMKLSTMAQLPLHRIKLAQDLVQKLCEADEPARMVRAALAMADSLGISVVAEGVNSEQTLAAVHALGVREVQGFFVCAPLDAAALQVYLGAPE